MEVTSSTATANSNSAALSASGTLSQTFDSFLLLLTTQLQNQDPLDPMDASQFTEQLVQFTGVEQSIATNVNLEQLVAMQQAGEFSSAVNYIGRQIEAQGATTALQDGKAEWKYAIVGAPAEISLKVLNDKGIAVFATDGVIAAGAHNYVWDGKDANGADLPEGTYSLKIEAADINGDALDYALSRYGRVTGAESQNLTTYLNVGGTLVPFSEVMSIKEVPSGT